MSELKTINIEEVADYAVVALESAENVLNNLKDCSVLTSFGNYEHEIGMFYAYMNVIRWTSMSKYFDIENEYHDRIEAVTNKAEKLYRSLKEMCKQ